MTHDALRLALKRARDRVVLDAMIACDRHGPDMPRNLARAVSEYRKVWAEYRESLAGTAAAEGDEKMAEKPFDFEVT